MRRMLERVTPGPWHTYMAEVHQAGACPSRDGSFGSSRLVSRHLIAGLHNTIGEFNQEKRNADFIAAARTDVPELLAEVELLRDALEAVVRDYTGLLRSDYEYDGNLDPENRVASLVAARALLKGA